MLTSFTAQRFRLFEKLEIRNLSRVNLFVGRNNAGKSALLEAIEAYVSGVTVTTLLSLVEAREGVWDDRLQPRGRPSTIESVRHLFKNHQLPSVNNAGFVLGTLDNDSHRIEVSIGAYLNTTTDNLILRRRLTTEEYKQTEGESELALIINENGKDRRLIALDRSVSFGRQVTSRSWGTDSAVAIQKVSTCGIDGRKAAALWDIITLKPLESEIIKGLKIIEPRLEAINFVQEEDYERAPRIALARLSGEPQPLPLRSMGDGITRLLDINLALVNAKGGFLLVDEFENGLHWSVQRKVWQTVFRLAEELDVQVFASTHSRDCVKAFQQAWADQPQSGAFFRLENDGEGNVTAQPYSLERLTDAEDVDTEVR